jgi:hypothetical protein
MNELFATVARDGFAKIALAEIGLTEIIQSLRQRHYTVTSTSLKVKDTSNARPNTLSAKYGLGGFPFHSDFAFCARPPRYILLLNETDERFRRPTLVAKIEKLEAEYQLLIRNSIWTLLRLQKYYLVSGRFVQNGQTLWRWDCDFLTPANDAADKARRVVPGAMNEVAEAVDWDQQSAVLIDNWKCAHARGEFGSQRDTTRTLTRYEFWAYAGMVC